MKINQVEQLVGITKKNIRFYEEQGLLHPSRNAVNGYREYSEADVDTLLKIKLLRKLAVPIDEIRSIQENRLTLSECMRRHIISLEHDSKNLIIMKEMCDTLEKQVENLSELDAPAYLSQMEELEKGGTRFMDISVNDQRRKKYGTITAAVVMILLMLAFSALLIWAELSDPLPFALWLFIFLIPVAVIVGVLLALRERFKEIEGGEENEATKY